jgi:antitoxin YefM
LPFLKGKKVEVLIIVEEDETDYVSQNHALMQQIELSKKTHQERTGYTPTDEEMNAILSV